MNKMIQSISYFLAEDQVINMFYGLHHWSYNLMHFINQFIIIIIIIIIKW